MDVMAIFMSVVVFIVSFIVLFASYIALVAYKQIKKKRIDKVLTLVASYSLIIALAYFYQYLYL